MNLPRKVAVIGSGEIGAGWAALCASAGWPVTVFDVSDDASGRAFSDVPRRARALVELGRAPHGVVERGLVELTRAHSLTEAVEGADWVIESVTEDVVAKQKLWATIELAAGPEALFTSSSSSLPPIEIFGRCRSLARCLVAHPLNPPELIPIVEVVPEGRTTPASVARAQDYLNALGRMPILVRKPVPGYVVGRVAAAVWRECIDLVLQGVIDVSDLDRAVSLGPALGWAAAGPHLTYHLGAGDRGVTAFLQHLLGAFERLWDGNLATWHRLEPEQQRALTHAITKAYSGQVDMLREARDRRLSAILKALEEARTT